MLARACTPPGAIQAAPWDGLCWTEGGRMSLSRLPRARRPCRAAHGYNLVPTNGMQVVAHAGKSPGATRPR